MSIPLTDKTTLRDHASVFSSPKTHWLQRSWLNFAQKTVLHALQQMQQGTLTLHFLDGSQRVIGNPTSPLKATIHIENDAFFQKILLYGHIGIAESYMDGDWETDSIANVIAWAIYNIEHAPVLEGSNKAAGINLLGMLNRVLHGLRPNSLNKSRKNIRDHYDLGNEFFSLFLDPGQTYSSAYFRDEHASLEEAQTAKYEALCQKLRLQPQDHVLEIGTGWGGFVLHAARNYGCRLTSITISQEQFNSATQRVKAAGLEDQITILLQDYRTITGQFDKIASIEMLEAVGDRFMETFFGQCSALLKKDGLLALQYITCPDARYDLLRKNVDFIQKHIFPGSLIPSVGRVNQALNRTSDLSLLALDDMGNDYAQTLKRWRDNFNAQLPAIQALGFDERFIRKWNYYFDYCRAAFEMRNLSVVQAVYTRPNNISLSKEWQELRKQ